MESNEIDTFDLDDACQALYDLLQSSLVLTTVGLHCFSLTLDGFDLLISGLASSKTATTLQLQSSILSEGSFELLRSRLDDLAHLEELMLDVNKAEHPEILHFLSDASRKLPNLQSLYLENWEPEYEHVEASAIACVGAAKTNLCLRDMDVLEFDTQCVTEAVERNFFLKLNRLGGAGSCSRPTRYLWRSGPRFWPRMTTGGSACDAFYYFLRHKLALVRARGGGVRRLRGDDV